ncbi:MAG TPA: ferritin-like fold-containing protein [Microbacteriaceae bacterium]
MASSFKSRRLPTEIPRLKPRSEKAAAERVDLAEITPELLPYLGQVAYLQLEAFQVLARVVASVPDLRAKEGIAAASGAALAKFHGLIAEIRRHDADPTEVMEPFVASIDAFQALIAGSDWPETLLGVHVTTGLLDDFFIRLAVGLPGDVGPRTAHLLGADAGTDDIIRILQEQLALDASLGSRLAMWGRRLVGDTLLVARSALPHPANRAAVRVHAMSANTVEARVEPVFTDVIAAHTRRMDALGLTA